MSLWIKIVIFTAGIVAAVCISLYVLAKYHENKRENMVTDLCKEENSRQKLHVDFDRLKSLPSPVKKYFRNVLKDGQPYIKRTHLVQSGQLTTGPEAEKWLPFTATQETSGTGPGFLWNAKISIMPLAHIRVVDSYINCKARGSVFLMSALKVGHETDNEKLNSGALFRYLAEAVWCPTALLPENGVRWTSIDSTRALAAIKDCDSEVSLEFTFNEGGEIIKVYTENRYGLFEGEYRQYPWEGHFSNYIQKDGVVIPARGEVGWHLPSGFWLFWKGQIEDVRYVYD